MNTSTGEGDSSRTRSRDRSGRGDVKARLARIKDAGANAGEEIARFARARPLLTAGIAATVGFLGGSVLGTRTGRFLVALAASHAARDALGAALGEGGLRTIIAEELTRVVSAKS
jgi:hypothetical protein